MADEVVGWPMIGGGNMAPRPNEEQLAKLQPDRYAAQYVELWKRYAEAYEKFKALEDEIQKMRKVMYG